MFEKCEFCEKCDFENVNVVKNKTLKMWILWKMISWKCEFCEKWDFENVNFVKNKSLKLCILWKMRFWKCKFCDQWDFQDVIFFGFLPQCVSYSMHWGVPLHAKICW